MPLYDYECRNCGFILEDVLQPMTQKPLKKCNKCMMNSLKRIITGGIHGFVSGSDTIGGLADKNAKINKSKIAEAEHKKREETPETPKPWYNKYGDATTKEINKMTPQQKTRYIMEGRK